MNISHKIETELKKLGAIFVHFVDIFLASDRAKWITGQVIKVDSGHAI